MIQYFKDEILQSVSKQRKKTLWIYLGIILGVYLAISVATFVWYLTLPYGSPTVSVIKGIQYPATALFVIASFIYLSIPYKRVNKFYKLCKHVKTGLREKCSGKFFEYDANLTQKDGVDCKSLVFIEWNKYKNKPFERSVLVFYELPFPEIPEGAMVEYVTQGNVLVEYEIIEEKQDKQTQED
ncbi:MAG: hypothetical protein IKB98_08930 [Clostridia bacterium]|nr:hypothetical protein [Clostridia bacterium]